LSRDERLALIKLLLNPEVKKFNFEVLDAPIVYLDSSDSTNLLMWGEYFDVVWTELAAKCPNLTFVREMRPNDYWYICDNTILSTKVFTFSQLTCLETNCTINAGKPQFKVLKLLTA